jgi:serine protease AprX
VNVKVGDAEGANDVSQVVAAIDWVVAHRNDRNLHIRVLNLSWGTVSGQSLSVDPIAYAAENAWRHGIVVVAAAGNDGESTSELANPAGSPVVVAVGASDPNGTLGPSDDVVPSWAEHGTAQRPVDVVAPGVHVAGLRVPGSLVDVEYPDAVVGERFVRGSGTSQAAAVVSGVAALLVDKYPNATPDQIKALLRSGADSFGARTPFRGRGRVSAAHAVVLPSAASTPIGSDGSGSIEASRGGMHVADEGVELVGERDIFGAPWDATSWAASVADDSAWDGGSWRGALWAGADWLTWGRWAGVKWDRPSWAGGSWSEPSGDLTWDGSRWTGSRWTGSRWTGSRWTGSRWTGSRWTGSRWTGVAWG